MKMNDMPLFQNNPPVLPTHPFLWEKSEPALLFLKISKTRTLLPFYEPLIKVQSRTYQNIYISKSQTKVLSHLMESDTHLENL